MNNDTTIQVTGNIDPLNLVISSIEYMVTYFFKQRFIRIEKDEQF